MALSKGGVPEKARKQATFRSPRREAARPGANRRLRSANLASRARGGLLRQRSGRRGPKPGARRLAGCQIPDVACASGLAVTTSRIPSRPVPWLVAAPGEIDNLTVYPDYPAPPMGSVIVTWKGRCPGRDTQDELLSHLEVLAQRNDARWSRPAPPRPAFLEIITQQRGQGLPALPNIRRYDQVLSGTILVRSDLVPDRQAFAAEAKRWGITPEPEDPSRPGHFVLRLNRLRVRGLDFRLFDPRGLYPGQDRMSFVFLECEDAPFLDGMLAAVDGPDWCASHTMDLIRSADWYVQCPFIHLRYLLEEWTDEFLSWIKFFFVPDLRYWRNDDLPGYGQHRGRLEEVQSRLGAAEAKNRAFADILDAFERETDRWVRDA